MTPVSLADSVWLHFGTSSATTGGATNADSTPVVTVSEDGVDMAYSPTVTNVTTGLYTVQIDATAANGFEAGRRYSCYAAATVGGVTGRDGIGEFEVLATDLNSGVASVQGNVTGSVASVTGAVGSVTAAVTLPSIPADWITASGIAAGAITASEAPALANLDAAVSTRMATFTLPANFSAMSITAGGAVTAGTVSDKAGYTISGVKTTLDALNDITAASVWSVATRQLTAAQTFNITGNITGNLSGSVGSVTGAVTVGTNNDKTGYALTQAFPTNFSAMGIAATGEISADIKKVNAITVTGSGTPASPWGP